MMEVMTLFPPVPSEDPCLWPGFPWRNVPGSHVCSLSLCVCECVCVHTMCMDNCSKEQLSASAPHLVWRQSWGSPKFPEAGVEELHLLQDEDELLESGCAPSGSVSNLCKLPTTWALSDEAGFAYINLR